MSTVATACPGLAPAQPITLRCYDRSTGKRTYSARYRKIFGQPVVELELALHRFDWSDRAKQAGIKRDALYLVRPDGYVALASAEQQVRQLKSYVARFHLDFAKTPP